jgi:hypothetical protein
MSILQKRREAERAARDRRGWRIARIEPGAARSRRAAYGLPILLALALLVLGAMGALLLVPLVRQAAADPAATLIALLTPAHTFLLLLILLFVIPLALGFYGSVRSLLRAGTPRWIIVEAHCLDRDVQPVVNIEEDGEKHHGWSYRLLCEFELEGETVRATPDGHDAAGGRGFHRFDTPQAVHAHLDAHVDDAGRCRLQVNAHNPQQTRLTPPGETESPPEN